MHFCVQELIIILTLVDNLRLVPLWFFGRSNVETSTISER